MIDTFLLLKLDTLVIKACADYLSPVININLLSLSLSILLLLLLLLLLSILFLIIIYALPWMMIVVKRTL